MLLLLYVYRRERWVRPAHKRLFWTRLDSYLVPTVHTLLYNTSKYFVRSTKCFVGFSAEPEHPRSCDKILSYGVFSKISKFQNF